MRKLKLVVLFNLAVLIIQAQPCDLEKFNTSFKKNLNRWMTGFTNFKLSNFTKTGTEAFENITVEDFGNIKGFYDLYKPLISFSKDRTQFIDIYSYQLNLVKERNKIVAYPEIDQAICLCDLKNKSWNRILFGGYDNWIEDVAWVSNTKFILAGIEQDDAGHRKPKIFIGDTDSRTLDIYLNKDRNCIQKNRYQALRLQELKIEGLKINKIKYQ